MKYKIPVVHVLIHVHCLLWILLELVTSDDSDYHGALPLFVKILLLLWTQRLFLEVYRIRMKERTWTRSVQNYKEQYKRNNKETFKKIMNQNLVITKLIMVVVIQ